MSIINHGFKIIVFLFFAYVFWSLNQYYVPQSDEAKQINSTKTLLNSGTYTLKHSFLELTDLRGKDFNLSKEEIFLLQDFSFVQVRNTSFPLGYSIAVASLVKLGLSLEDAVKIFRLLGIGLVLLASIILASNFLTNKILKLVFVSLNFSFAVMYSFTSVTDTWILGLFMSSVLILYKLRTKTHNESLLIFLLSLTSSIMVLLKYTSIPIVASLFFFLLIKRWSSGYSSILKIISLFIPATSFVLISLYFNYVEIGSISSNIVSNIQPKIDFSFLLKIWELPVHFFQEIFILPRFVHALLAQPGTFHIVTSPLFFLMGAYIIFFSVSNFKEDDIINRDSSIIFLIAFLNIFIFLFLITLIYLGNENSFIPVTYGRYYFVLGVLFLIKVFRKFDKAIL